MARSSEDFSEADVGALELLVQTELVSCVVNALVDHPPNL
jgi:hypothetical protein